ncbi:hypothetical protein PVAP13_2NG330118 [Panicum virgatum]|uniref:Uncharacterized protein n=1 Tax=Panicum virgatum TaxID=38727 RepID=A0A8T0VNJ6_PANVG|nr:hypothetical protein PVAP13_2NG330118 [Panicum virgatum]
MMYTAWNISSERNQHIFEFTQTDTVQVAQEFISTSTKMQHSKQPRKM